MISRLFFGTSFSVNINGYLSTPCRQTRGLRQGDPLSSLLLNIALEPFLRAVQHTPLISGFSFSFPQATDEGCRTFDTPDAVKCLAYADDILVFLTRPDQLHTLLQLFDIYSHASNTRLNRHKTMAVSLSGRRQPEWQHILQTEGILHWQDRSSPECVEYLGYPLSNSPGQLNRFLENRLDKVRKHVQLLSQRSLFIMGRALVANALLLSRV